MNIYVGNLPYSVRDEELRAAFAPFGAVKSAQVIMDRRSGRSRGYGFVEMDDEGEALRAIAALNGSELQGRQLRVDRSGDRNEKGAARDQGKRGRPRRAAAGERPAAQAPAAPGKSGGLVGFLRRLFG